MAPCFGSLPCRLRLRAPEDANHYRIHHWTEPHRHLHLKEAGKLREALTPHPDGREKLGFGGGYLRFRKIYFGFDGWKPSGAVFAAVGKESVAA